MLFDDLTIKGGGQRLLLSLARELNSLGHRVTVFTPRYDPSACYPELCADLDIRTIAKSTSRAPSPSNWLSRGSEKLKQHFFEPHKTAELVNERFDILNPHERPAHRAAVALKRKWGTPIVWMFNDPASWEMNYYENARMPVPVQRLKAFSMRKMERSLVRQIDAVAVLSHGVQALFHREFGIYPRVVRCGLDKEFLLRPGAGERVRARLQVARECTLILFLAVLSPSRRVEDLIAAVAQVRRLGKNVKLAVVGSSRHAPEYLAMLKATTVRLDISQHVHFFSDSISEEDRRDFYYACDIFVWPNEAQSWGLAPLEAMLCGKPTIVSLGAGVHEVLQDGKTTLLVPPRRPDLIQEAMVRLMDDPDLRAHIAAKGSALARARFSWKEFASELCPLFEEVQQPTASPQAMEGERFLSHSTTNSSIEAKDLMV
jgi:glycosyltransferase involved in cell wall biosynthesis